MKTFDWQGCFKDHPVFWDLVEDELTKLLDDELTREIICQPNQVIVREGDQGDSVFFVGAGEVNIVLQADSGPGANVAILGPGEFFGEMAVLEGRPRMATVIARDRCTLLEIDGARFREFLIRHPEIEFKIAAKLSQRLRDVTEHVLTARFKDVDQKLELFNNKLESELRVIDASMKATQAVFDQTNKRANEIIESAERSRSRLTTTISVIAGALGIVITALGFLGVEKINQIEYALQTYDEFAEKVEQIDQINTELLAKSDRIVELDQQIEEAGETLRQNVKRFHLTASIPLLSIGLRENDPSAAQHYRELMEQNDKDITTSLFKTVTTGLFNSKSINGETRVRDGYIDLLEDSIRRQYLTNEQEVATYYLMLSTMVIAGMGEAYEYHLPEYYRSASEYRKSGGSIKDLLKREFDPATFVAVLGVEAAGDPTDAADDWSPGERKSRKEKLDEVWSTVP